MKSKTIIVIFLLLTSWVPIKAQRHGLIANKRNTHQIGGSVYKFLTICEQNFQIYL
jgi:hypothetical protein